MKVTNTLCNMRTSKNLLGGMINVENGRYTNDVASIGAGSDSFYEYLLKTWFLTGDVNIKDCFEKVREKFTIMNININFINRLMKVFKRI